MTHKTIYQQFRAASEAESSLPFLIYPRSATRAYLREGAEISYGEALAMIDCLADQYAAAGYCAGHRVALVLGNRPEYFLHLFALNRIGASAIPLNPEYLDREYAFGIESTRSSLVVAEAPQRDKLGKVVAGLTTRVPVVDGTGPVSEFPPPAHAPMPCSDDEELHEALILYTSGTTGKPKGCIFSNRSCLAAGESYVSAGTRGGLLTLEPRKERVYVPLPSFHMTVNNFLLNCMTKMRGSLVVQDRFHIGTWWSDIVETGATGVHYLGIIPPLLLKQPPSEMDRAHKVKFGMGAGVDPEVRKAFEERFGFPLIEGWGMTETSRTIHNIDLPRCLIDRAFGRPRPPLEARVVDENDQPLPPGTPGEMVVRCAGPDPRHGFFSGYLNQPEETEHAWRNGWFHSGDIVKQLPDGMLVFVERRKNIIRRSGENIAAAEVEEALIGDPRVQGVAVIAVADEFHDEEVMACVVPMPEVPRSMEIGLSIVHDARDRIARHKLPAWLAFVDELPVTGTQKVRKGLIFAEGSDPRADPRSFDFRMEKRRLHSR